MNTDFPGLPVIQFLTTLCIESNSNNSTVRNRLLLQFINFRNAAQSRDILQSSKTSRIPILLEEPTNSSISTVYPEGQFYFKKHSIHSFIHAVHICVSTRPSKAFQTFQGSTLIQCSLIRMHILQSAGFQKTPQSTS